MAQTRNRSMSKRRRLLKSFFFSSSARLVVCSTGPTATSAIKGLQGDQEQLWADRTLAATTVGRGKARSSRRGAGRCDGTHRKSAAGHDDRKRRALLKGTHGERQYRDWHSRRGRYRGLCRARFWGTVHVC